MRDLNEEFLPSPADIPPAYNPLHLTHDELNTLNDLYHGDWHCYLINHFVPIEGKVVLNSKTSSWDLEVTQCLTTEKCGMPCLSTHAPTLKIGWVSN